MDLRHQLLKSGKLTCETSYPTGSVAMGFCMNLRFQVLKVDSPIEGLGIMGAIKSKELIFHPWSVAMDLVGNDLTIGDCAL